MQLTLLPITFQNYSIQPACEIWRCGAQGDNSVWAASWSALHEQWGEKVDGWYGDGSGAAAYLFSLCLAEDFLVCSCNIMFSLSGAFFLNSSNSEISGGFCLFCPVFTIWGDYIAVFISLALSVPVALLLHGGIRYGIRARSYIVSFTFWKWSFSFQHRLN